MAGVLITHGGPHSAEKWAMATAERIFDITKVAGERVIAARKLQMALAESIISHHDGAQTRERAHLEQAETAEARKNREYTEERDEALAEAVLVIADVQKAAVGTPWEDHWKDSEVVAAATTIIASDLMSIKHIERSWHTDRQDD